MTVRSYCEGLEAIFALLPQRFLADFWYGVGKMFIVLKLEKFALICYDLKHQRPDKKWQKNSLDFNFLHVNFLESNFFSESRFNCISCKLGCLIFQTVANINATFSSLNKEHFADVVPKKRPKFPAGAGGK